MRTLNSIGNNAQKICLNYCERLLMDSNKHLTGVEMGIAYGGGVESKDWYENTVLKDGWEEVGRWENEYLVCIRRQS